MERLSECSSAGDYGGSQNDEEVVSDSCAVEGAGYSLAAAGGDPADDVGGDPPADADLEDDGIPGAEDVCASWVSLAVAGWAVPAGDEAEETAVWLWRPKRGYAVLGGSDGEPEGRGVVGWGRSADPGQSL